MGNRLFDRIKLRKPRLNKFDLSFEKKLSCNMGQLIPVMCDEVLPGERRRLSTECMMRLAPMIAPVMHRVNVRFHHFFVPNRLIWSEWEKFITGGADGTEGAVPPYMNLPLSSGGASIYCKTGSLADYLGVPPWDGPGDPDQSYAFSALPFRAYQLVWDTYFRDQTLQTALDISKASGEVDGAERTKILELRNVCWEKDYFTSALPFAQRGVAAGAPVTYTEGTATVVRDKDTDALLASQSGFTSDGDAEITATTASNEARFETPANVMVSAIRRAEALQRWLEKNARAGARYVENLLMQFGVRSSDARLQRPEYLGGSRSPVSISEVLSNVLFDDGVQEIPQGNMAGHGIAQGYGSGFTRRFEEHGFVISLMSVLPRTGYQSGAPRMFFRTDRFDYPWPDFAHIGEQAILNKELYVDYTAETDEAVPFGYQSRYAEYKFSQNSVHGEMRESLDYWHMGRIFGANPTLTSGFVEAVPTKRIFAVESEIVHCLYVQLYFKCDALRPLPMFSDPY